MSTLTPTTLTPISSRSTTPTQSIPLSMFPSTRYIHSRYPTLDNTTIVQLTDLQLDLPRSSPPSDLDLNMVDELEDEMPGLESPGSSDDELGDSDDEVEAQDTFNSTDTCRGQRVEWTPGSLWDTFPYQQHADNTIGWRPFVLEGDSWMRLKSTRCKERLCTSREKDLRACANCLKIVNTASYRKCVQRAEGSVKAHTPWKFLSPHQLRRLILDIRKQNNAMKLNVCLPFT